MAWRALDREIFYFSRLFDISLNAGASSNIASFIPQRYFKERMMNRLIASFAPIFILASISPVTLAMDDSEKSARQECKQMAMKENIQKSKMDSYVDNCVRKHMNSDKNHDKKDMNNDHKGIENSGM